MGLIADETRNSRPRFLRDMLEKRSQKKRASSFDATLSISSSSSSSLRNSSHSSSSNSLFNPSVVRKCSIVEEEGADASILRDALYKKDIALANRVAALNAQKLLLGENHSDVLFSLQNLAALHYRRGEYAQARCILEDKHVRREQALQPDHKTTNIPSEIFLRSEF
jgi:hypothetical protein